ncbi:O-antigen ligase family protein [Candidatus Pelagibacter sp.]|nr:O-antigen ligase family protein [Candidatus Pelagibacter sp.]
MTLINKDEIIKYLLFLLPIALVLSIFFSEFILFIISIFFIRDYLKEEKKKKNFFYILLILFGIYISFSSISFDKSFVLKSTFFYFRFLLYFFAIIYYLKRLDIYDFLIKSIILVSSVLLVDGIVQFFLGYNIIGISQTHEGRVSSFFGDELILGSYLVRLLPFFLIFFTINHKINKKIQPIFLVMFLFVVILSGERTALFFLFLYILIFFVFLKELRKVILFFSSLFLIIIFLLISNNQNYHERYFYNLFNSFGLVAHGEKIGETKLSLFNEKDEIKKIYIFSKQHEHHYQTAFKMFKDKMIFGHGPKSFRVKCKEEKYKISNLSCATHPHNILMQFLSELGLIGFIFLFLFHILLIRELIKIFKLHKDKKNEKKILLFSLSGIIVCMFPLIPSGNFFNNWLNIILILNLANYIYFKEKFLNV